MDKQAVEILTKARALILRGWCQNTGALDASGNDVLASSPRAVKWCAAGALARAEGRRLCTSPREFLRRATKSGSYVVFNDKPGRKKSAVLAMFDKAIKLAKE